MSVDHASETTDAPTPTNALPPVPLTDDQLAPLADHDAITAVYVPEGRPESVTTRAGTHRGDILDFYVETADQYIKYGYTSGPDGLRWARFEPTPKDGRDVALVEIDLENYRRLEVSE